VKCGRVPAADVQCVGVGRNTDDVLIVYTYSCGCNEALRTDGMQLITKNSSIPQLADFHATPRNSQFATICCLLWKNVELPVFAMLIYT